MEEVGEIQILLAATDNTDTAGELIAQGMGKDVECGQQISDVRDTTVTVTSLVIITQPVAVSSGGSSSLSWLLILERLMISLFYDVGWDGEMCWEHAAPDIEHSDDDERAASDDDQDSRSWHDTISLVRTGLIGQHCSSALILSSVGVSTNTDQDILIVETKHSKF